MTVTDHEPRRADADEPAPPPAAGERARALVLLAAVAALVGLSLAFDFWKPLLVIAGLFVMIMLHELGHYVMARRGGMKATEFFVGFGPRLWSVRRGETEFGVKAIPLGGYVKIIGMTNLEPVPAEDEPRTYRQQPFWQRFGVAVAGSTTHLLLAFLLLLSLNAAFGNPLHRRQTTEVATISKLETGQSPAEAAGLQVGDRILALDGGPVVSWADLRSYVAGRPGQPIAIELERDGRRITTTATPVDLSTVPVTDDQGNVVPGERNPSRGFLGISSASEDPTVSVPAAVVRSGADLGRVVAETGKALGGLLSFNGIQSYADQLGGGPSTPEDQANRFLSPVGVFRVADATADAGVAPVLFLLVMINVFVGLFNMLPLLPFDGGHVVMAVYEAIRSKIQGRRHFADFAKVMPVAYVTVALLAIIGVSSLYLDLFEPLQLQ